MFETEQALELKQTLKLELILLPEKIGIIIFGHVIKVTDCKGLNKNISVQFEHLRDDLWGMFMGNLYSSSH